MNSVTTKGSVARRRRFTAGAQVRRGRGLFAFGINGLEIEMTEIPVKKMVPASRLDQLRERYDTLRTAYTKRHKKKVAELEGMLENALRREIALTDQLNDAGMTPDATYGQARKRQDTA